MHISITIVDLKSNMDRFIVKKTEKEKWLKEI